LQGPRVGSRASSDAGSLGGTARALICCGEGLHSHRAPAAPNARRWIRSRGTRPQWMEQEETVAPCARAAQ
jgi:hypothetical protein